MKNPKLKFALVSSFAALVPAIIWFVILSVIQWVLIKSGANGEWIGEYKIYVAVCFYFFAFILLFIQMNLGYKSLRRK